MKRRFKKHKRLYLLLILFISIGFAYLSTTLGINGLANLRQNTWDVHFANIVVSEGSVEAVKPVIDTNKTTVTFSVPFSEPGDFYEFTVDAVNAGTIGAMIDTFTDVTTYNTNLLNVEVTYDDGEEILQKHLLPANDFVTFKIKASYKEDITKEDLPGEEFEVNISFSVNYINKDKTAIPRNSDTDKSLYNVFKREALFGNLAKEYTGPHQDSMDASKSNQKIYHWYAETDDEGAEIQNKNNLIFANHCWEMIRTTDTGGVKLLYNGEAVNQQCLESRSRHPGYSSKEETQFNNNLWYSDDFEYDYSTNRFSLSGNKVQASMSEQGSSLEGKYTCKSESETGTCSFLYYIEEYKNGSSAKCIRLTYSANKNNFGTTSYNTLGALSSTGYKKSSTDYTINSIELPVEIVYEVDGLESSYGYYYYYYADEIQYDSTENKYTLVDAELIDQYTKYDLIVGKYTFIDRTSATTSSDEAKYIIATKSNDGYFENVIIYYIPLKNGNPLDYYNSIYTYGDSYVDNGDGTYTINNANTINRFDWKNNYEDMNHKYICKDAINNTCNNLMYSVKTTIDTFTYNEVSKKYKYSNDFTYSNGKYHLNSNVINTFSYNTDKFSNAHYTCWNKTGECSTVSYIFNGNNTSFNYINLSNGNNIEDVKNDLLYSENTNSINSNIKEVIDFWYKVYMLEYDEYIEDTIFCNNRSQSNSSENGWNPNGGDIAIAMRFKDNDLSCDNILDKFSVNNNKANLKYKVGLISSPELNLLNNSKSRNSSSSYWTMTPYTINQMVMVNWDGTIKNLKVNSSDGGIRPSISLKPNQKYIIGDGSKENPYYIGEVKSISCDDNQVIIDKIAPAGKKITINTVDDKYSVTSFKLNGVTHLGNTFIMPNENVTITDIVKSEVFIVESDHNPYLNNLNNKVYLDKTFEGASALNIELTYQTEGTSWDYIYLYDNASSSTPYNNKKYGGTTQKTESILLNSNYLKIVFKTDSTSNNYYGFKAVITPIYD